MSLGYIRDAATRGLLDGITEGAVPKVVERRCKRMEHTAATDCCGVTAWRRGGRSQHGRSRPSLHGSSQPTEIGGIHERSGGPEQESEGPSSQKRSGASDGDSDSTPRLRDDAHLPSEVVSNVLRHALVLADDDYRPRADSKCAVHDVMDERSPAKLPERQVRMSLGACVSGSSQHDRATNRVDQLLRHPPSI